MARSLRDRGSNSGGMIDGSLGASFVKRILGLLGNRDLVGEALKEVYAEAKNAGFPAKHLRQFVKVQRMNPEELREWNDYQERLEVALGPYMDTPLGAAAVAREERVAEVKAAKRRRGRPPKVPAADVRGLFQAPTETVPNPEAAIESELDRIIDFPGSAA